MIGDRLSHLFLAQSDSWFVNPSHPDSLNHILPGVSGRPQRDDLHDDKRSLALLAFLSGCDVSTLTNILMNRLLPRL